MLAHHFFPGRIFSFTHSIINLFSKYLLTKSKMSGTMQSNGSKLMNEKKTNSCLFYSKILIFICFWSECFQFGIAEVPTAFRLGDYHFTLIIRNVLFIER